MGWRWDSIPEGQSEGQRRRLEREEDAAICGLFPRPWTEEEKAAWLKAYGTPAPTRGALLPASTDTRSPDERAASPSHSLKVTDARTERPTLTVPVLK